MFGEEMIDEASRKMALKFVSRGERAGLKRSGAAGAEPKLPAFRQPEISAMPELPQMQALAERLDAAVAGRPSCRSRCSAFPG